MVIKRESGTVVLHGVFEDFSRHWGYQPRFCRPYRPQTKEKVESGIKFVKKNFLAGRRFRDSAHLNEELSRWNREVADLRIHGTTGARPIDRFQEERLVHCPTVPPYLSGRPGTRRVSRDGWVHWKGQRYSVPLSWGPITVRVEEEEGRVVIQTLDQGEVRHALLVGDAGQSRLVPAHHRLPTIETPTSSVETTPPQYDPRWQEEEFQIRSLQEYDLLATAEVA